MDQAATQKELTDEEKAEVFQIARASQGRPKFAMRAIQQVVGTDRLKMALDYLLSVSQ